ncbi:DinB family protein [Arcticibacterium luteifluviistationis]|uniref:DinB family protein n=1 Tax=Arcticibacterium luteifluviistationis TaxID=1784714 RepID=UPI001E61E256|nr:DinB family protein [Arcticibacterium luteifluviistationis]
MSKEKLPEVWLRGPIPEIPALLQPAAHALLQTAEELHLILKDVPNELLTREVAGRATPSFHLKHLTGVLDRMLTYAHGDSLSKEQFDYLRSEKATEPTPKKEELINAFEAKVNEGLTYFKSLDEPKLIEVRGVGRKQLPSTVIGLLFHAAEHAQRHLGQLLVTVSVLKTKSN